MIKKFLLLSLVSSSLFAMQQALLVIIKSSHFKDYALKVNTNLTVLDLKDIIHKEKKFPVEEQIIGASWVTQKGYAGIETVQDNDSLLTLMHGKTAKDFYFYLTLKSSD